MALKVNKGKADELFNFTPMIDVVFNLLLFFMVAARFAQEKERELDVQLPAASEARPITEKPSEIYININQQGQMVVANRPVTVPELDAHLQHAATNNPTNQAVIIRADKRVPFEFVVAAMNACNKARLFDYTVTSAEEQ